MDQRRKAARHDVRRTAFSKNAAVDAIQILAVMGDERPASFRRLFSSSSSSSSVMDDVQNLEGLHTASSHRVNDLPPKTLSVARHALKNVAMSKSASNDVMEFLHEAEATNSFRWLFPRFRSSSTLSCDSSSSFHTCIEDEDVLNADDDNERSQIQREDLAGSSELIPLAEVDDNRSSVCLDTMAVAREQGEDSEANQRLDQGRRNWTREWRKGGTKTSKLTAGNSYAVNDEPPPTEVPQLSLALLKTKTDNFGRKTLIGEGSYGCVYYALLDDRKQVAIKVIDPTLYVGSESKFMTQILNLSRLKHNNVVKMLGYCAEGNYGILAYEYATNGSLHDILHGRKGVVKLQPGPVLSWMQRVRIAVDVANGLQYLHERVPSVTHGHIRSTNVILFEDYKAKIMDLSLSNQSTAIDEHYREIFIRIPKCSSDYFPPEYYPVISEEASHDPLYYACPADFKKATFNGLTKQSDVYNFGVVLLELLTGRPPPKYNIGWTESLVTWAGPRLKSRVYECVDPRLSGQYRPKAVAKFATVAALCLQQIAEFRPDMNTVVKALSSLLVQKTPMDARDVI